MIRSLRKWHRRFSIIIILPFGITLMTGIILATRSYNNWVQPKYPAHVAKLTISFEHILKVASRVPEAQIKNWEDVSQIDIRPASGNIRVRSKNMWELQIDGATGRIIGKGIRRFSFLVAMHEGAYFGTYVRYGIFFPSALIVLFLLISGTVIFFQSYVKRKKTLKRIAV